MDKGLKAYIFSPCCSVDGVVPKSPNNMYVTEGCTFKHEQDLLHAQFCSLSLVDKVLTWNLTSACVHAQRRLLRTVNCDVNKRIKGTWCH